MVRPYLSISQSILKSVYRHKSNNKSARSSRRQWRFSRRHGLRNTASEWAGGNSLKVIVLAWCNIAVLRGLATACWVIYPIRWGILRI